MDKLTETFVDVGSSSSLYATNTEESLSSDVDSMPSLSLLEKNTSSLVQESVIDIDSMFLSNNSYSAYQGHSSLSSGGAKISTNTDFLGYFANNIPISDTTSLHNSDTFDIQSIDFMLENSQYSTFKREGNDDKFVSNTASIVQPCISGPVTCTSTIASTNSNMVKVALLKPMTVTLPVSSSLVNKMEPIFSSAYPDLSAEMNSVERNCNNNIHLSLATSTNAVTANVISADNQLIDPISGPNLKDPSSLKIIICNVVASFRVRCHLNLRQIALESFDVVYRREAQKVVMRMRKPKCTAYIWSSGKIVCTGSTSAESAKKAAKKFSRRLQKIGFKIRFADFKVVNVLAVSKMPYSIAINEFSQAHKGKHCSYEPELHPGVTYRDAASKATLKIFSTGSVTVTARSVPKAQEGIRNLYPLLGPFYKFNKPNIKLECDDALPSDQEDLS